MEEIEKTLKAVIGDKAVQIIDGSTGKELSLDELVSKLSANVNENKTSDQEKYDKMRLISIRKYASEIRRIMSTFPESREISISGILGASGLIAIRGAPF
jgi:hypothetical protein